MKTKVEQEASSSKRFLSFSKTLSHNSIKFFSAHNGDVFGTGITLSDHSNVSKAVAVQC
jgi:hypothetical protein